MPKIKPILFVVIALVFNSLDFPIGTSNSCVIYAQECFKGGVYEIDVQYKYPKGREIHDRDYKKIFYIHEEKSNPGFITLYELVPIPINTPLFNKGGLVNNEFTHYFIRGYCNHKWDGQHIFLPQSKHLKQESTFLYGMGHTSISLNDNISSEACPVSLYFYGYYHNNTSPSPAIQDTTIGLMKLVEYKETKLSTVTITSRTRKLDWSDNFVKRFKYFSKSLMTRYNNIINQRNSNARDISSNWEERDRIGMSNRTYYLNMLYNFPVPEWHSQFPVITDSCIGFKQVLFNINGSIDSREVIWDMFNEGIESNKNVYKSEIIASKEKLLSLSKEIESLTEKKNSLVTILDLSNNLKSKLHRLNDLFYNGKRSRLFESNEEHSGAYLIYDDELYRYNHIHDPINNTSELKLNATKPVDVKIANAPKESSYSISYLNDQDYSVFNDIKISILNINTEIKSLLDKIDFAKPKFNNEFTNHDILSISDGVKSMTRDSMGVPKYLDKQPFVLYGIDTTLIKKNIFGLLNNDLGRVIDFIQESHRAKDYDLDKSDKFLEKQLPTNSDILNYLKSDPKKGAKIIANIFALQSSSITSSAKKLADFIDDGDISELLSELYNLDEDDIEDELENITESKLLSDLKLNKNTFVRLSFNSNLTYLDKEASIKNNPLLNHIISLENKISRIIDEIKPIIDTKNESYKSTLVRVQNAESLHSNRVKYTSKVNVINSNIPDVDYADLCSFLSNYNMSRGIEANLFKAGSLRSTYIERLIKNNGNSLITRQDRYKNLVTFEPVNATWNIVSYTSDYFKDDSCKGYGHLHISGFLFDEENVTLNTVSIGNMLKK
jgi:hypothetical protein